MARPSASFGECYVKWNGVSIREEIVLTFVLHLHENAMYVCEKRMHGMGRNYTAVGCSNQRNTW